MIADGIVVVPEALLTTRSGPNSASNSTASHITAIASDAHISTTRTCENNRRLSGGAPEASCETVVKSNTSFLSNFRAGRGAAHL
jgi:hypothetical protein